MGTQNPVTKVVRAESPAALLSVVPGLLGFVPADSVVILGVAGERDRVQVTLRYDLPDPSDIAGMEVLVRHATSVLPSAADAMFVVVYGSEEAGALAAAVLVAQDDVPVLDVLRVEGDRFWSFACDDPKCCPAEGTPFTADVSAEFGTVLSDRQKLADSLRPVPFDQSRIVREAIVAEAQRVADMPGRAMLVALNATQLAIASYRSDEEIGSPDEVAAVLVGLRDLRVRDDAWSRMDPEHVEAHLRMWTDLTRLAPAGLVAAPASLLAFCAWQDGNGALANVALDRALADNPQYSMANLLRQVITSGAPPSLARLPMTPEEVAASYESG